MEVLKAPSRINLFREPLGLLEIPRLALSFPSLATLPRGKDQVVMVLPGFATDDTSTFILRYCLKMLGYQTYGWGLGRNHGSVEALAPLIVERVAKLSQRKGRKIDLIGWSLGGYIAREVARDRPEHVNQVITFGSPLVGGPKYTTVGKTYEKRGIDLDALEAKVEARNREPLVVPLTVIYSKLDGVVAWRACLDKVNESADHYEVRTTHIGLGFSPDVYRIIVKKLDALG